MKSRTIKVATGSREEISIITAALEEALASLSQDEGICTLFTPHTTCALTINENADPDVLDDLLEAYRAMIPAVAFKHGEGNSDAHFLSSLIGASLQVPFRKGRFLLGRWQGIYFIELDGPRKRDVILYVT